MSFRFANTSCSQCGRDLGPVDAGTSHCDQHASTGIKHLAECALPMPWEPRAPLACVADFRAAVTPELFLDMLAALAESVDAMWHVDSHAVRFDGTVLFSEFYDFSGLESCTREEFLAEHECVVWRSGGKWSGYCTFEGSMWFEQFDTAEAAKEQCMRLLDRVLPSHPAMKARAVIAKATGIQAPGAAPGGQP